MKSAITIGSYDGLHLGHQKIINDLVNYSLKNNLKSVVIYFPLPPRLLLQKKLTNNLITLPSEREELFKRHKVDEVFKINFTEELARKSATDFFENFILKRFNPEYIVVGKDFSIGRDREGNSSWLIEICKKNLIKCKIISFVKYLEHKISSSLIRQFLHSHLIEEANKCLGRRYSIKGVVVKGMGIGRKIGFPTANMSVNKLKILPRGIYAVEVRLKDKYYRGVISIGRRPTLKTLNMEVIPEVHIMDFNMEIYNREIEVYFISKIRDEIKFENIDCLVSQIKKDLIEAKKIFSRI